MHFPVNIAKFLRTAFFIEHLWWLLLIFRTTNLQKLYYAVNQEVIINIMPQEGTSNDSVVGV